MATGVSDVVIAKAVGSKRSGKSEKDRPRFLARHRMHRSSVRPFFCCGSQLSLNSITELKDLPTVDPNNVDDDYEDLSDTEDIDDDNIIVEHASTSNKSDKPSQRSTRFQNTKRKKGVSLLDKSSTRKKFWSIKLRGKLQLSKQSHCVSESELNISVKDNEDCVCTSYRHSIPGAEGGQSVPHGNSIGVPVSAMAHLQLAASGSVPFRAGPSRPELDEMGNPRVNRFNAPLPFIGNLNALYPINDIDEQLIAQRRYEMEHGVDLGENVDVWVHQADSDKSEDTNGLANEQRTVGQYPTYGAMGLLSSESENLVNSPVPAISVMNNIPVQCSSLGFSLNPWLQIAPPPPSGVHTQVDYKHHLVPDLGKIINSSFYWGVMDRYQAEKLIENKAEGTFLLRDSAQDEFLFSVSFRRYGRSLHARIEQWNHKFSFDSRDPGVFATNSVCGLIEHYKDPSRCMFFEPMLTLPMHRNFPFSLQHLTRATICNQIMYDDINQLTLPASLKEYLRFYHYKQKVRVRRFDNI